MLESNTEANPGSRTPDENEVIQAQVQRMSAEQVIAELNEVKGDARDIIEEINQAEQEKEAVSWNRRTLPDRVRENNSQQKLDNIVAKVKQTVIAIHQKQDVRSLIADQESRDVLVKLCEKRYPINIVVNRIDETNAFYICDLIGRGLEGRLGSIDQLIEAFASIKNLSYLDSNLYIEISNLFQEKAQEFDATLEQINELKTQEQKKGRGGGDSNEEQRQKKFKSLKKNAETKTRAITNLIDTSIDRDKVKKSPRGREIVQSSIGDTELNEQLNDEVMGIKSTLKFKLSQLIGTENPEFIPSMTPEQVQEEIYRVSSSNRLITPEEIRDNFANFTDYLIELRDQRIISTDAFSQLSREAKSLKDNTILLLNFRDLEGQAGSLYRYAANYISNWEEGQEDLLKVLDDKNKFLEYAKSKDTYNGFKDPGDWEKFQDDIRALYETIFSATASNPKDFWERSFNELTEGIVYKMLNGALIKLGGEIGSDQQYGEDSHIRIGVRDYYAKKEAAAYEGSLLGGGATLTEKKIVDVNLGKAIKYLTHEMIDYKELSQYGHDINVLCELGLGFEKLAELSGRLRIEDVTRMIKSMPGLADAMQLYHTNLLLSTSLAGRAIPVEFGRQGIDHMDPVGRKTYLELKSSQKIRKKNEKKYDLTISKDRQKYEDDIVRLVRLSAGLSKGVTAGFFGAAWGNLISVEYQTQKGESSEKIKTGDVRDFHNIKDTYKSMSDRGIEKMVTSVDIYLNLRRFQNPRFMPEFGGSYCPRDLKSYKPDVEDIWTNHTDIGKWNKEMDRARGNGRSNELIDKDKKHLFFIEAVRTRCEDLAMREGWRFFDYRRYLVYEKNESGGRNVNPDNQKAKVDFYKTIRRLEGVGPQLVKIFINDLFDNKFSFQSEGSDLTLEDVGKQMIIDHRDKLKATASPGWDPDNPEKIKLNNEQKGILKLLLYEEYIFDPIRRTRPSQFIAMEDKRWMTEDDVRGTLLNERDEKGNYKFTPGLTFHDQLTSYLVETYGAKHSISWIETNLLPMYISAVQVVEKNEWDKRFEQWVIEEKSGIHNQNGSFFDYTLQSNVFESSDNRDSLRDLYQSYQESIGKTQEAEKMSVMRDEDFRKNVKGFYERMTTVLDTERWDHNQVQVAGRWSHLPSHKRERLTRRYSEMLACKGGPMGGVDRYISWNLLNMDEFYFETSGNRSQERMFGEAAVLVKGMVPELGNILMHKITAFTKKKVEDIHQLEQSIKEHFGEHFQKIFDAVANIDADTGWDYCGKLMMCIERMMVQDKVFRIGVIGPIMAGIYRKVSKGQQSFTTSKVPITDSENAQDLDSTGAWAFYRTLGDVINMPREEEQVDHYEPAKLFGIPLKGKWAKAFPGKPVFKEHKDASVSIEHLIKNSGVETKKRILEQLPMIGPIFLILMGLLLKLALDKDKKK